MLNFYYWYAIIWSIIIIMYTFKWSDFFSALDESIVFFFSFSIIISILIGYYMRKDFDLKIQETEEHNLTPTIILCLLTNINILYSKSIPLLDIINGDVSYLSFKGIPVIGVIINTVLLYYGLYISWMLANNIRKKCILEFIIITLTFSLLYNRLFIFIMLLALLLFYIQIHKIGILIKIKWMIIGGALTFYLFGILGNFRNTGEFLNSQYIKLIGKINDSYPEILPDIYAWTYIYLVSPLANLNLNVINDSGTIDIVKYILCFCPEFIVKYIPNFEVYKALLITPYLTVSTGYVTTYHYLGILGMIVQYVFSISLSTFILKISQRSKYKSIILMSLLLFNVMFFFTNPFYYTTTSLFMLYSVVLASMKIKIKLK